MCVLQESYRQVMKMRPKDLWKRLMVKFRGEEGLDYGGVARYKTTFPTDVCLLVDVDFGHEIISLLSLFVHLQGVALPFVS